MQKHSISTIQATNISLACNHSSFK